MGKKGRWMEKKEHEREKGMEEEKREEEKNENTCAPKQNKNKPKQLTRLIHASQKHTGKLRKIAFQTKISSLTENCHPSPTRRGI